MCGWRHHEEKSKGREAERKQADLAGTGYCYKDFGSCLDVIGSLTVLRKGKGRSKLCFEKRNEFRCFSVAMLRLSVR